MAELRYFCEPGAEVSFADGEGKAQLVVFDAEGFAAAEANSYVQRVLDDLADLPGHPVQHADAPKTKKG